MNLRSCSRRIYIANRQMLQDGPAPPFTVNAANWAPVRAADKWSSPRIEAERWRKVPQPLEVEVQLEFEEQDAHDQRADGK